MLNQMFTAENFRHVFDAENRRGIALESSFFPSLATHTALIREKVEEIRHLNRGRSGIPTSIYEQRLSSLKLELEKLRSDKDLAISALLEEVAANISKPQFNIALTQSMGPKGKTIYRTTGSAESFFVSKQIQKNLHTVYKVKPANRHESTSRLVSILHTEFPLELIRTDIASFYESVDSNRLMSKLDNDQLLGASSRKFVRQILHSYKAISGASNGIPRGVGVSAYLAEIYLRDLDRSLQSLPGVTLYVRYVDDIAVVFSRIPEGDRRNHLNDILSELGRHGLSANPKKTSEHVLNERRAQKFSFLGYRFKREPEGWKISPSGAKIRKLRMRISTSFEAYEKHKSANARHAFRALVARVRFLTGNTRLLNSKGSAVTGIYYNNSYVTNTEIFRKLDRILKIRVSKTRNRKLKARLKPFSFTKGFLDREYRQFNSRELETIVKVWRHVS